MAPDERSAVSFVRSRQLFLRLLGLVYLIAFVSLGVQIRGLVGERGILPVGEYLGRAFELFGPGAYRLAPTLLWLWHGDAALMILCWGGAVLAAALVFLVTPVITCALLWLFYLSLVVGGQVFLQFQWDSLLLETGLLACLLAPLRAKTAEPNAVVRWVLWSLAFKLTFLSGMTKILSGDPAWAGWTAMTYHYWTQPLPTWTSWYASQLPPMVQYWSVPLMLAIEVVAPLAILLPGTFRRTRLAGCALMILLQVGIGATGNYGFFNLLSIVLYLALLDDGTLPAGRRRVTGMQPPPAEPVAWRRFTAGTAIAIGCLSAVAFVREMQVTAGSSAQIAGAWPGRVLDAVAPLQSVNGYGLFRVMTTMRPELVIEVSDNGTDFKEYEFRWKAGDPTRRPRFVEPHMPRLDWQMWFAALDPSGAQDWLDSLGRRILEGEPTVLQLLGPRPLRERPTALRLAYYDYRFTSADERAATGAWWSRTPARRIARRFASDAR